MPRPNGPTPRSRRPGAAIRNAGDTSSTKPSGLQHAGHSSTSPTSSSDADDSEITLPAIPYFAPIESDKPITHRDFKIGAAVAATLIGAATVGIPLYVNSAKVETKVDYLKESGAKIEQKVDRLFEENANSKTRLQSLEKRVDKVEDMGSQAASKKNSR